MAVSSFLSAENLDSDFSFILSSLVYLARF